MHGRAAAEQTGLINGCRATVDVQKLTCIIKEVSSYALSSLRLQCIDVVLTFQVLQGLPHAGQLSASYYTSFDKEPNGPPILVAVNIPRVSKDGKMKLAVLLGRRGATAVCWSVGEFHNLRRNLVWMRAE